MSPTTPRPAAFAPLLSRGRFRFMEQTDIPYEPVRQCPLCGGRGVEQAALRRRRYSFGPFIIPLPPEGIQLLACERCNLLYKSDVPEPGAFGRIMAAAAAKVWRPKTGVHPAVAPILRHLPDRRIDILDIGASNGDLLAQLRDRAGRLSALDIERFPRCEEVVTGEYIIGEVEQPLHWSGIPYGLVTAFDVFEHFRDPGLAVDNIVEMTADDGLIVIETGDWSTAAGHLDTWYYTNLFEHHVFWSRPTFEHVCEGPPCRLVAYDLVEHKGRRALSAAKRAVLRALTSVARVPGCASLVQAVTGRDPTLFGPPSVRDHAFVVLRRIPAGERGKTSQRHEHGGGPDQLK